MAYQINRVHVHEFKQRLIHDEKSLATIEKYMRDLRNFQQFLEFKQTITKETVMRYKEYLMEHYAPASVNSMLASVNCFFKTVGWYDCIVKSIRIQKESFRRKEKELSKKEYYRLLEAADRKRDRRLYYLMQTLCATGIRVSELRFITTEALCTRRAVVSLKGKTRTVLLPLELCRKLKQYVKEKNIQSGPIFVTRSGKPVDRSNICHEMKALEKLTGIDRKKIFPHNLRHLFACVFYEAEKDLFRLADLLGHSNVNTTRIYTQISSELQEKQINTLRLVI